MCLFIWDGAIIPPLSGIIISSSDNSLRGDGFSICSHLSNLLGNFPSSFVYSLLVDSFESNNSANNYRMYDDLYVLQFHRLIICYFSWNI